MRKSILLSIELIAVIGLALPRTLMANECVLSVYASPVDPTYSRRIEDLDHLRASGVKRISWWTPCNAREKWCPKAGKSGEKIYDFDKLGRVTHSHEDVAMVSSDDQTFTYAGSDSRPTAKTVTSSSFDGKKTTSHFTRGRDGELHLVGDTESTSSRDYHDGDTVTREFLSPELGLVRVTYRNGLLTEQVQGGGLRINAQSLKSSYSPSNTDVTTITCERKADPETPGQTLVIEHTKKDTGATYVSAWSKLDSLNRTVKSFELGLLDEQIQKGLGTGRVSHYADIDGKGNWQTTRTCKVYKDSDWETGSSDCWETRRTLEYYSGDTKR